MIELEDLEETLDELGIGQGQHITTLIDALKDAELEDESDDRG